MYLGTPTITSEGSLYAWEYPIYTASDEIIDTSVNDAFITIFDIGGYVTDTEGGASEVDTISSFNVTIQNTGLTPSTQNPPDDSSIPNISIAFNGTAPASTLVAYVSFDSSLNSQVVGYYSSQCTNSDDDGVVANTGEIYIPG